MKRIFQTLHRMVADCRGLYILNFVFQFLMVLSTVMTTFMSKVLVDTLQTMNMINQGLPEEEYPLNRAAYLEKFLIQLLTGGRGNDYLLDHWYLVVIGLGAFGLFAVAISIVRMQVRFAAAATINKTMQLTLFSHLEKLPYPYFKTNKAGDLIQTCTRDVDVVRKFILMDMNQATYTFFVSILCFSILMSISWKLTLVSLSILPIMFVYSFFLIREVRRRYRQTDDSEAVMTDKISENLNAVRIVKAYHAENIEIAQFEDTLQDYKHKFVHWRRMSSFFFASSDIFIFASRAMAIAYALYLVFTKEITAGTVVISYTFVNMMVWPLRSLATSLSNLGQSLAANDRMLKILDEPEEDRKTGIAPQIRGQISFDHVTFAYDDDAEHPILSDVNFSFPAGSTIAIMGKTGSGKSTVSMLLTRLYDATSGEIRIDGTPINEIGKAYLRTKIVPVLQDPFLFSKSIQDNITLARPDATMEDIKRASYIASVDEAIASFDKGFETPVGEKGVTLSGGQKQRVAIARTIISDAPVLIFDDSLSAVDTATDLAIRTHLKELAKGKTTILITHRIATAKDADLILVLEDGKLVQKGTHEELVKQPGLYGRIAKIQTMIS